MQAPFFEWFAQRPGFREHFARHVCLLLGRCVLTRIAFIHRAALPAILFHRLPALPQEQNDALSMTPCDQLLELPFLKEITDTLKAYQYSKRCNVLRVMYEATRWGM